MGVKFADFSKRVSCAQIPFIRRRGSLKIGLDFVFAKREGNNLSYSGSVNMLSVSFSASVEIM